MAWFFGVFFSLFGGLCFCIFILTDRDSEQRRRIFRNGKYPLSWACMARKRLVLFLLSFFIQARRFNRFGLACLSLSKLLRYISWAYHSCLATSPQLQICIAHMIPDATNKVQSCLI